MKNRTAEFTMILLLLSCFALSPLVRGQLDPPPDGGYPGRNTAEGDDALFNLTIGTGNTALGYQALFGNTEGGLNTAAGRSALTSNIIGNNNTATGFDALSSNTNGNNNTANGALALVGNLTGSNNTAIGYLSLSNNTTGINNTATGYQTLANNSGDNNTAAGVQALFGNTLGIDNTATGLNALFSNTEGNDNTATGHSALQSNITGNDNTAEGHDALFNNTTGSNNIALGHGAGSNLTTGDNNIDIGFIGVPGEASTIRIGTQGTQTRTFVAGINGAGVSGVAVKINASGQLGTAPSSARFKRDIKPMDEASEAILALKPVSFCYKKEIDPDGAPQFGLVAEEVERVNPALVVHDPDGKPYTVRYEAVNAMLLNEFLKEHRKVEQLKKDFESKLAQQQKQIEALTTGLQNVSAQLKLTKPTPQIVVNDR